LDLFQEIRRSAGIITFSMISYVLVSENIMMKIVF
jgi:hypothetical protein